MKKLVIIGLGIVALVIFAFVLVGVSLAGSYNGLIKLDQQVQAQWAQVENVYQRRADLIPNLVATTKGAADFEKETFTAVTQARSGIQAPGASGTNLPNDPAAFAKAQQAQDQLSSALSRLMVVVEKYPDLKANANFQTLQSQLEGTENRIATERMRFNETAQAYNTKVQSFPTNIFAGFFGGKFQLKPYFKAQAGSETAPKVQF